MYIHIHIYPGEAIYGDIWIFIYKSHACPGSYRPWGGLRPPLHSALWAVRFRCVWVAFEVRLRYAYPKCLRGWSRGWAAGELIPSELYHQEV